MKMGFSLKVVPNVVYHVEECRAKQEMVVTDIPEDNLPMLLKDALDDIKDYVYINSIIRMETDMITSFKQ